MVFDHHVLPLDEARLTQRAAEGGRRARHAIGRSGGYEPDHWHRLLRARRDRPRRRAAEQRDERAALHSRTSLARSKNASGIVSPSALAVVRLTMRSNFLGCSTGMSPGFAPRRILST